MQKATQHMGDYKLKSSSDYVVSEEQRMTTEKTRKQLLLMRKMVMEEQYDSYPSLLHHLRRYLRQRESSMRSSLI